MAKNSNIDLSVQLFKRCEELKPRLIGKKDLLNDVEAWSNHQQLMQTYQKLLLTNLEFALENKVEQDLWNYAFKNYISFLQSQVKDKKCLKRSDAQVTLTWFLEMASGYYFMLLEEMRAIFEVDVPFLRRSTLYGLSRNLKSRSHIVQPHRNSSHYILQHCLVHLGDIARYKNQTHQAETFYRQAIQLAPGSGQPYNQIAILEANKSEKLSTVYFYIRSIALKYPFPAASTNLSKIFSKVTSETHSISGNQKISASTFISLFLKFHGFIYLGSDLEKAKEIGDVLVNSLNPLISLESLSTWTLIQMLTLNLFSLEQSRNQKNNLNKPSEASHLIYEIFSGTLNSLLLPVYTLKQGIKLLDYFALPAIKLILEWLRTDPSILDSKAFLKRMQIWPSFCKMLNDIYNIVSNFDIKKYEGIPLPEDYDLQGFKPLQKVLIKYRYKDIHKNAPLQKNEIEFLRAARLLEIGRWFASPDFAGSKLIEIVKENEMNTNSAAVFRPLQQLLSVTELMNVMEAEKVELENTSAVKELVDCRLEKADGEKKIGGILKVKPGTIEAIKRGNEGEDKDLSQNSNSFFDKKQRNVAIQAIIKAANISPVEEKMKQVTFKTPSPSITPNDNNSLSQDSGASSQGNAYQYPYIDKTEKPKVHRYFSSNTIPPRFLPKEHDQGISHHPSMLLASRLAVNIPPPELSRPPPTNIPPPPFNKHTLMAPPKFSQMPHSSLLRNDDPSYLHSFKVPERPHVRDAYPSRDENGYSTWSTSGRTGVPIDCETGRRLVDPTSDYGGATFGRPAVAEEPGIYPERYYGRSPARDFPSRGSQLHQLSSQSLHSTLPTTSQSHPLLQHLLNQPVSGVNNFSTENTNFDEMSVIKPAVYSDSSKILRNPFTSSYDQNDFIHANIDSISSKSENINMGKNSEPAYSLFSNTSWAGPASLLESTPLTSTYINATPGMYSDSPSLYDDALLQKQNLNSLFSSSGGRVNYVKGEQNFRPPNN